VAEIAPGERLVFETQDAQAGTVKTHADALQVVLPIDQANPVTGPVYVTGAQPGDTLAVRILEIRLGHRGLGRVRPGRGVLGDKLRAPAANLIPIQDDRIIFNERIQFPIRPMIGTIGTAGRLLHRFLPPWPARRKSGYQRRFRGGHGLSSYRRARSAA
jgi:amidase